MTQLDFQLLIDQGNKLEQEFNKQTQNGAEIEPVFEKICQWLNICVDFGKYLDNGNPERRALQGRVDFWTSKFGMLGKSIDVDRIAAFDPNAGFPLDIEIPYPGLKAYKEGQKGDFYGRDDDTKTCIQRLIDHKILLIIGESGTGKSSLALAGVLPELKSKFPEWAFAHPFTPGTQPFKSFCRSPIRLNDHQDIDTSHLSEKLRQQPNDTKRVLSELIGQDRSVLFIIDQFEELLTLCQDAEEQKAFAEALCSLLSDQTPNVRILLTLRADHQTRFENSVTLAPLYKLITDDTKKGQCIFRLKPIGFDNIRLAIERPARRVGLRFIPPSLIDKLASQSASLVDGLPLLQFALERLWELRPDKLDFINEDTFKKLPTVQGALGTVAEEVFQSLGNNEQQDLCQRLMLELVLLDENFSEPLRRRRAKSEILTICRYLKWPETLMEAIIAAFVDKKLLRLCGENDEYLEVAHEAMFRNWERFREWISGQEAKTRLNAIKTIEREATDWQINDHSKDLLKLSGQPLSLADQYKNQHWLIDSVSTSYIEACHLKEQSELALKRQTEETNKKAQEAEIALAKAEAASAQAKLEQTQAENEKLEAIFQEQKARQHAQEAENARKEAEVERLKAENEKQAAIQLANEAENNRKLAFINNQKAQFQKKLSRIAACTLFVLGLGGWYWYQDILKTNALISAQLTSPQLLSGEALDLNYTLVKKQGASFNSLLGQSLENLKNRYLFPVNGSEQGNLRTQATSFITIPNKDTKDPKINIFRLCQDGILDKQAIELPYEESMGYQISPPRFKEDQNKPDLRYLFSLYQPKGQPAKIQVSELNWHNQTCEGDSAPTIKPKAESVLSFEQDFKKFSTVAFSKDGKFASLSSIAFSDQKPSTYQLKIFDLENSRWTDHTPETIDTPSDNGHMISAVAFPEANVVKVTGRLNGDLYCDGQLQTVFNDSKQSNGEPLDKSPIEKIITDPNASDLPESWFLVRLASGKIIPWQCGLTEKQEILANTKTDQDIESLSIRHIKTTENSFIPLIASTEGSSPSCWIRQDEKKWSKWDCNSTYQAKQIAITPDQKNWIAFESSGDHYIGAMHRFPFVFVNDKNQWISSIAKENLWTSRNAKDQFIVWQKGEGIDSNQIYTQWKRDDKFNGYLASPAKGVTIIQAAISSNKHYIAWFETSSNPNEQTAVLKLYDTTSDKVTDLSAATIPLNILKSLDIKVTDQRNTYFGYNDKINLIDSAGKFTEFPSLSLDFNRDSNESINCLNVSENGRFLVIGTANGKSKLLESEKITEEPGKKPEFDQFDNSAVSACYIGDNGTVVTGYKSGRIGVKKLDSAIAFELSPKITERAKTSVLSLSFDNSTGYIAALFEKQNSGCSASGLSGQSIKIWGELEKEKESPLISSRCLPNRPILAIGAVNNGSLPVAFADGFESLPCLACRSNNKSPEALTKELIEKAEAWQPNEISDEKLQSNYGIKF